ncbi:MAG TPA: triose-phosphate isomerase [Rubricoccaceae bacterium]|jgi:triosephosphate isomerase
MLVLGNWKMNTGLAEAVRLASDVVHATAGGRADVGVCPPAVWLDAVAERLRGSHVALGAQNVYPEASGAFTGEVSPAMLADVGCRYVLVGHSERRAILGESSAFVAHKTAACLAAGLVPVLCVGETLDERDGGRAEAVVADQLLASLDGVAAPGALVVAYEPVWAIGTGRTASPEQAQAMHAALRTTLAERFGAAGRAVPLLYGGSVNAGNAATLFAQPDVDGALVGGASLDATAFAAIVAAAG